MSKEILKYEQGKNPNSRNGFKKGHKVLNNWGFQKGNQINKDREFSKQHKKQLSESHKGKRFSEKHKQSLSESHKGIIAGMLGKHHSPETIEKFRNRYNTPKGLILRKKIGKEHKGDKCSFWQGGISDNPYSVDWTETLKRSIRKRDNYICQECGVHQNELERKLDVHHIDYNKDNLNPNNLISLCRSCHIKTNCNRDYWIKHFYVIQ